MKRLSSNTTLFLKLFIPVFWLVFYGSVTISFWFMDPVGLPLFSTWSFKFGITLFFIIGSLLLYLTFFQLKRVELDTGFVYVSNYFKTYRYPFHQIEKFTQKNYLLFRTTQIHFSEKQSFGRKITFIARRGVWKDLASSYPDFFDEVSFKDAP